MASTSITDRPAFAVIIPHYNDTVRLARCLDALALQDSGTGEVVVVDNGSTEPLDALIAAHPTIRFVTEPAKGAAAARTRGVAETTAEALFFLDADCIPAPDWLATAQAVVTEGTVIGGRIDVFDETAPPRSGAEAFETVFAFHQQAYVEEKGFSVTANLVTTRSVFEDAGPMVVGLSEDMDWCFRTTAKGHRLVYEDRLAVRHPSRGDWAGLARKWRRMTTEGFALNGVGPAARVRWALRACLMPASVLVHVPKVLGHKALTSWTERRRALTTLARLRLTRAAWMLYQAAGGRI